MHLEGNDRSWIRRTIKMVGKNAGRRHMLCLAYLRGCVGQFLKRIQNKRTTVSSVADWNKEMQGGTRMANRTKTHPVRALVKTQPIRVGQRQKVPKSQPYF